ncbi:Na/Pi cotransporter family protein [Candidatus Desulforudis audaxviator]|nr:Na/Pi symporter [Candidatus Desulforudis audaxviator]AZK60423.1 Sodium-dependent phosphate transporter [Candidatus Desulforudis audaxviator]
MFLAGLFILLAGLRLMQGGLEHLARGKMRRALLRLAGTPFTAALTGLIITALVQSSTAVSVLTIGFVHARVLTLPQAIGIILGANVGTCLTVQLMSLDIGCAALPAAVAGSILWLAGRGTRVSSAGRALTGFGLIFLGLEALPLAFDPWAHEPWFVDLLSGLRGHYLGAAAAGAVVTGILHSSATSTGLIIALAREELLGLPTAVAFILGNNVGTCFTAILASLGSSPAGKKVALAHLLINLAGAAAVLPFTVQFAGLITATSPELPGQVAMAHTIFNAASSLAFLPFVHPFAAFLDRLVPCQS